MESHNEILDTKSGEERSQQNTESDKEKPKQIAENTNNSGINRKVPWNSATEKETFRTVVLSCNFGKRCNNLGAIPKSREALMLSTNTEKEKAVDQDCNIYNLREMYQMSHDSLCDGNSKTETTLGEPTTFASIIPTKMHRRKSNGSRHSIKVDIFNMPPLQKAETIERPLIQVIANDVEGNKKLYTACRRPYGKTQKHIENKGKSFSSHSIKLEIYHMPMSQNVELPIQFSEIIPQEAEIMIISGDDDDTPIKSSKAHSDLHHDNVNEPKTGQVLEPHESARQQDGVIAGMEMGTLESKKNSTNMDETLTKSTQKPEGLIEAPTQTSQCVDVQNSSCTASEVIPRSSTTTSLHKQRQLELHRFRVQVEKKRLELLEIKLNHEHQQMLRDQKLFDRDIEMIRWMCRALNGEKDI